MNRIMWVVISFATIIFSVNLCFGHEVPHLRCDIGYAIRAGGTLMQGLTVPDLVEIQNEKIQLIINKRAIPELEGILVFPIKIVLLGKSGRAERGLMSPNDILKTTWVVREATIDDPTVEVATVELNWESLKGTLSLMATSHGESDFSLNSISCIDAN